MFAAIFKHEVKHWFATPSTYVYVASFFILAVGTMAGASGIFGEGTASTARLANNPVSLYGFFNFFTKLLLFLVPAIIGGAIYRDYRSNIHAVLYSFPFNKRDYLFAKFLSAFSVLAVIAAAIGVGFLLGAQLPGVNPALLAPFHLGAYAQIYAVYVLPNLLLFSALVFAIVTFSRNVYAGFITVVLLLIAREVLLRLLAGVDTRFLAALLEPFGEIATGFYTRDWSLAEQNERGLPLAGLIVYNRLLVTAIAAALVATVYKYFSFSHTAGSFARKPRNAERVVKNNFGSIIKVSLPAVRFDYSFRQRLNAAWELSHFEFRFIVTGGAFISLMIVGALFVAVSMMQMNPQYGTRLLPATWVMLAFPILFFSLVIHLLTFLYAGILVQRAKAARVNELVDATPLPNWVLLLSKLLALIKMQVLLLAIIMVAGVIVQAYQVYYDIELGHYLFDLYGIHLIGFVIAACAALLVQTLVANPYLGFFLLIIGALGITELPRLGIERLIFRFNQTPEPDFFMKYSDLSGYGHALTPYFVYKTYWALAGLLLCCGALLFWIRGLPESLRERLAIARARLLQRRALAVLPLLMLFLCAGLGIDYVGKKSPRILTEQETQRIITEADQRYGKYASMIQPRVTAVNVNMDLFPEALRFKSDGVYSLLNKSDQIIDTLLVQHAFDVLTKYRFNRDAALVSRDTTAHFDIHKLRTALQPGDSLQLHFEVESIPNTFVSKNSNVEKNGTFITSLIYPGIGYRPDQTTALPTDSPALRNHHRSFDSDYITFDATVSTSVDQIAFAPGVLQTEWTENGRRYLRYKSIGKATHDYAFLSGRYQVAREMWNGINLEIYYHAGHEHNLRHLMRGMKAALAYNENYFSPYQHQHARIIEYSRTLGNFAQSFASTIPYSEVNFMLDIDDTEAGSLNLPFLGAAHELSHQWWGHQVLPADVLGAKMITESMAEYVSLKVLEHEYDETKLRKFLQKARDIYFTGRANDAGAEKPLMYNSGLRQSHIPYQKGALVFYALSDFIGEENLNRALKAYVEKVRWQEPPYTTSLEMVDYLRAATPDSLQYLITDLFEEVSFYDNKMIAAQSTLLENGKYQVEIEFAVSKYRVSEKGEKIYADELGSALAAISNGANATLRSLPLEDYIELGIFGEDTASGREKELYLKRHKITASHNTILLVVDQQPAVAGVDPDVKLIDANARDNRIKIISKDGKQSHVVPVGAK